MYLQTSRLQYNLQETGVFQTAHSDKMIQAFACSFIISAICRNAIQNCCPQINPRERQPDRGLSRTACFWLHFFRPVLR